MELRHLRYFVAVAEDLNFSRAARRLHLSQPPLTQAIQRLEGELEARLFDRTSRSVRLTEVGALFLERARGILNQVERAVSDMRLQGAGKKEVLRVGFSGGDNQLPATVERFRQRFPHIQLELLVSAGRPHREFLLEGEADLNIGQYFPPDALLNSRLWVEAGMIAAFPASHPLAKRDQVSIRDLRDEPLLLESLPPPSPVAREMLRFCRERGRFEPRSIQYCSDPRVFATLVGSAAGVGIAHAFILMQATPEIALVPFREKTPIVVQGGVVWRRDRENPALLDFIDDLEGRLTPFARSFARGGPYFRGDLAARQRRAKG